jgi:serine/threonine protein phosphatase PrpC
MLSLRSAALTDIGRVRRENEDRFIRDEERLVFGVADGVGGLPGGGEAAQLAADEIIAAFHALAPERKADLVSIVHHTNEMVATLGRKMSPAMGIGTTLTFGCIFGGVLRIGHVGDSRVYGLRGSEFIQLSEDHSVENEARMRRARGDVVYYHEANRNALTRCIGQPTPPEVDVIERPLVAGDRYLFCTDGVTRMIPNSEIGTFLAAAANPQAAIDELVTLAVRRGGPDNATGVVVFVDSL